MDKVNFGHEQVEPTEKNRLEASHCGFDFGELCHRSDMANVAAAS